MSECKQLLDHLTTKLLYVEDDDDLRDMVAGTFVQVGFEVTAVPSAEDALDALGKEHYDVLITDYNLTNNTGAWLLENAASKGYLRTTPALVLTSERRPAGVDGYKLLRKPIAFTALLATISDALGAMLPAPVVHCGPAVAELELVHYVTSTSQDSQKAIRNLRRALKSYDASRFRLTIVDVASSNSDDWYAGLEADRIIVTPTLVRKKPHPKTWIVGALTPILPVEQMLAAVLGSSS
jgi:CheY-like chemotaxis protein